MTVYEFENRVPVLGENTYVSPSASIIGDVSIGDSCYVAPGAVVKGDYGRVVIGDGTSVQDNVVVHARPDEETHIGDEVTLGHGCIIHNATVEDHAVIGMGAIVSDYAIVREHAVVAEGAVVKARFEVPKGMIAVGVPAKIIAPVREERKEELGRFKKIYQDLARRYPSGLKEI
jgi:carbonic anhydrase/acetyltransferase-like protein (isoleucine patch superfamily)